MKFDTVIIGGGMAGLICGIRLQKAGLKTAIISSGQSVMHFSSGSFDLLDRMPDGTLVEDPFEAIGKLPETHPYSKIGVENVRKYAGEIKDFFSGCGIKLNGNPMKNSWRITPIGEIRPCWLSFEDFTLLENPEMCIGKKVMVANFLGYLDFNAEFIAGCVKDHGSSCHVVGIKTAAVEKLRKNPTEMRSTNIARAMDNEDNWKEFAQAVRSRLTDEDTVILPAVFGLKNRTVIEGIRKEIGIKTIFVATMPPSVPGIRTQMQLKDSYIDLGGQFILGDTVCGATFEGNRITALHTVNFEEIGVFADNFVLASGSFFSNGLVSDPYGIKEPVFNLDLDYDSDRNEWYDVRFFNKQNYFSYGVKTDRSLLTSKEGKTIENLFAAGSIISGANALYEGCGSGTTIMTALKAADNIIARHKGDAAVQEGTAIEEGQPAEAGEEGTDKVNGR